MSDELTRVNILAILPDLKALLKAIKPLPDVTDQAAVTAWFAKLKPLWDKLIADLQGKTTAAELMGTAEARATLAEVEEEVGKIDWAKFIEIIMRIFEKYFPVPVPPTV